MFGLLTPIDFLQKEMQEIGHKRKSQVAFAKSTHSEHRNDNLTMRLSQSDSAQVASWRSTPVVQPLGLT